MTMIDIDRSGVYLDDGVLDYPDLLPTGDDMAQLVGIPYGSVEEFGPLEYPPTLHNGSMSSLSSGSGQGLSSPDTFFTDGNMSAGSGSNSASIRPSSPYSPFMSTPFHGGFSHQSRHPHHRVFSPSPVLSGYNSMSKGDYAASVATYGQGSISAGSHMDGRMSAHPPMPPHSAGAVMYSDFPPEPPYSPEPRYHSNQSQPQQQPHTPRSQNQSQNQTPNQNHGQVHGLLPPQWLPQQATSQIHRRGRFFRNNGRNDMAAPSPRNVESMHSPALLEPLQRPMPQYPSSDFSHPSSPEISTYPVSNFYGGNTSTVSSPPGQSPQVDFGASQMPGLDILRPESTSAGSGAPNFQGFLPSPAQSPPIGPVPLQKVENAAMGFWVPLTPINEKRHAAICSGAAEKGMPLDTVVEILSLFSNNDGQDSRPPHAPLHRGPALKILVGLTPQTPTKTKSGSVKKGSSNASHVKRPLNSFMLYRRAQTQRATINSKAKNIKLNHQVISSIVGLLWQTETREVQGHFLPIASYEKHLHKAQHPEYKFQPRKRKASPPRKDRASRSRRSSDDDSSS